MRMEDRDDCRGSRLWLMATITANIFCRADDEETDFPDLAVTQTQLSHTGYDKDKDSERGDKIIIQPSDGNDYSDVEVSRGRRISPLIALNPLSLIVVVTDISPFLLITCHMKMSMILCATGVEKLWVMSLWILKSSLRQTTQL